MEPETEREVNPPGSARQTLIWAGLGLLVLILMTGAALAIMALLRDPVQTETIRDIVIIFMALESLIIGLVLVILIVQLARLTALLQNEVKPILESTNETVNTLRGTTAFLSSHLVKPVIQVNSSMAAVRRVLDFIRPGSRRD
jgi:hypothetical protein